MSRPVPHWYRLSGCFAILSALLIGAGCTRHANLDNPERLLEMAREEMLNYDVKAAKDLLNAGESLIVEGDPLYGDYLYLKALSYWHALPPIPDDVRKAEEILEQIAIENPEADYASSAWLYVGRIRDIRDFNNDLPDYEGARVAYQKVMSHYPESMEASEAAARHAMTYIKQVDDPDMVLKGVGELEVWLAGHPDTPYSASTALFLAQMYDEFLNDPEKALEYYDVAYTTGFVSEGKTGARLFRMAELAKSLDRIDRAIEYSQMVVRDYARSGRGYEAVLMLREIQAAHPDKTFEIPELKLFEVVIEDKS